MLWKWYEYGFHFFLNKWAVVISQYAAYAVWSMDTIYFSTMSIYYAILLLIVAVFFLNAQQWLKRERET